MSTTPQPWDEYEPVTEALERWGLLDAFNAVIADGNSEESVLLLEQVGVDRDNSERIVAACLG